MSALQGIPVFNEAIFPFYVYRHIVRPPGISGWAQVNQGNVAAIDAIRQKFEYDFFYIKSLGEYIGRRGARAGLFLILARRCHLCKNRAHRFDKVWISPIV